MKEKTSLSHKIKWGWYYLFRTPKGKFEIKYFKILLILIVLGVLFLDLVIYLCHIG